MTNDDKEVLAAIATTVLGGAIIGILAVFGLGWCVTVFWNMCAHPMFDLPAAEWRNGMGFVGFLICVKGCLGASASPRR